MMTMTLTELRAQLAEQQEASSKTQALLEAELTRRFEALGFDPRPHLEPLGLEYRGVQTLDPSEPRLMVWIRRPEMPIEEEAQAAANRDVHQRRTEAERRIIAALDALDPLLGLQVWVWA